VAHPINVVPILIAGEPSEYRLPQQAEQFGGGVLAVRALASMSLLVSVRPSVLSNSP
jgi:hypothetical protein